jgi:hypothetical protein
VSDSRESVILRTVRGAADLPLLRVVVSSLASRANLNVDELDDVQLAVETLLAEEPEGSCELVLEAWGEDSGLSVRIEGLVNSSVKAALLAGSRFEPCENCLLDVRLMLESLVDGFSIDEDPAGSFSVQLDKRA